MKFEVEMSDLAIEYPSLIGPLPLWAMLKQNGETIVEALERQYGYGKLLEMSEAMVDPETLEMTFKSDPDVLSSLCTVKTEEYSVSIYEHALVCISYNDRSLFTPFIARID